MKKPIIAVDIDDVLTDSATGIIHFYNKNFGTTLTTADYYSKEAEKFGVSHYDIAAARFRNYIESEVYTNADPIAEAVEAISRLSERYTFIGVTSRPEYIKEATDKWIKKHFGKSISHVIYTSFIMGETTHLGVTLTKSEACKEIGASYMVEDHLPHALPVAESGIKVFLINQPWNDIPKVSSAITRVSGWKDIEGKL